MSHLAVCKEYEQSGTWRGESLKETWIGKAERLDKEWRLFKVLRWWISRKCVWNYRGSFSELIWVVSEKL
jgi:hypothetical protein